MKSCVRIAQPDARGLPVDVDEHGQQLAVKLFQQRPDHLALRRGTRCLQHVGVHHERRQQLGHYGPGQRSDGGNTIIHGTPPAGAGSSMYGAAQQAKFQTGKNRGMSLGMGSLQSAEVINQRGESVGGFGHH